MEKVEWNKALSTGIEIMDKQHKIFIELCDNLDQSVSNSEEKMEIMADLKCLEFYAKIHFATEKKLMGEKKYPEKEGHMKLHKYFMDEIENIKKRIEVGEKGEAFAKKIKEKMTDWFIIHIDKTDRKLGKFINSVK